MGLLVPLSKPVPCQPPFICISKKRTIKNGCNFQHFKIQSWIKASFRFRSFVEGICINFNMKTLKEDEAAGGKTPSSSLNVCLTWRVLFWCLQSLVFNKLDSRFGMSRTNINDTIFSVPRRPYHTLIFCAEPQPLQTWAQVPYVQMKDWN